MAYTTRQCGMRRMPPGVKEEASGKSRYVSALAGFTLVELVVVILIIGVLASLVVPRVSDAAVKAKVSEACVTLASYDRAQAAYITETGSLGTCGDLTMQSPLEAGYSKFFIYTEASGGSSVRLTATAQAGISPLAGQDIWTEVDTAGVAVHDCADDYVSYAPSWR